MGTMDTMYTMEPFIVILYGDIVSIVPMVSSVIMR
jgi:hypothetical protein